MLRYITYGSWLYKNTSKYQQSDHSSSIDNFFFLYEASRFAIDVFTTTQNPSMRNNIFQGMYV